MSKNYLKAIPFIFFTAILSVFPFFTFASAQPIPSISLISDKTSCQVGGRISVALVMNTGNNSINAIEGTIQIPTQYFDISSVSANNSILSLWPEAPTVHNDGTITFTAGIPGGFAGLNGNILTITLKGKKAGTSSVSISDEMVLLNDGLATELNAIKLMPLQLVVSSKP